jgi:SNF2 family DNA or RNA helicase
MMQHQFEGAAFGAAGGRFLLGDEPGLGKTRQAVAWADLVGAQRVLAVVPVEVCEQFAGEFDEYSDRIVVNLSKQSPAERRRLMKEEAPNASLIVINYEIARADKLIVDELLRWQADAMIIDEAHTIKGMKATFKFVRGLVLADNQCPRCGAYIDGLYVKDGRKRVMVVCLNCLTAPAEEIMPYVDLERVLATKSVKYLALMTGTPLLNTPDDLFPLIHLIDPDLFPTLKEFRRQFCALNHWEDKYEFRGGALKALHFLLEPVYIARTKEDAGVKVPHNAIHIVEFALDKERYPKQAEIMRQISVEAQIKLESGEQHTIMNSLALITRKRQANVWADGIAIKDVDGNVLLKVDIGESMKMDVIFDNVMSKHKEGHRQVVFSQFATALEEMEDRLTAAGLRVARFDGSTPQNARGKIKTDFYRAKTTKTEARYDVILANYKTGGVGLNLTGATVAHIMDEEWNPGKRDQAYGRISRFGQTEETETYVYRLLKSVDTYMARLIRKKEDMLDTFATGQKVSSGMLSKTDLLRAIKAGEL